MPLFGKKLSTDEEVEYGRTLIDNPVAKKGDIKKSFDIFQKHAKNNHPKALNSLGSCYLKGFGCEQSYAIAMDYFQASHNLGCVGGTVNIGFMYHNGFGVKQDFQKGNEYMLAACKQDCDIAVYNIGVNYMEGKGFEQNVEKATEYFLRAAKLDCALGPFNLGVAHEKGKFGFKKDFELAYHYFKMAVAISDKQGTKKCPEAYAALGLAYYRGQGCTSNNTEAFDLFKKSSALGDQVGSFCVAFLLEEFTILQRQYYEKAGNYPGAINNIGVWYESHDDSDDRSDLSAFNEYYLSKQLDSPEGNYNYARMLYTKKEIEVRGISTHKSKSECVACFKKAMDGLRTPSLVQRAQLYLDVINLVNHPPDPAEWNEEEVKLWIRSLFLTKFYREVVQKHHLSGRSILQLENQIDWKMCGVSVLGDQLALAEAVQTLLRKRNFFTPRGELVDRGKYEFPGPIKHGI